MAFPDASIADGLNDQPVLIAAIDEISEKCGYASLWMKPPCLTSSITKMYEGTGEPIDIAVNIGDDVDFGMGK